MFSSSLIRHRQQQQRLLPVLVHRHSCSRQQQHYLVVVVRTATITTTATTRRTILYSSSFLQHQEHPQPITTTIGGATKKKNNGGTSRSSSSSSSSSLMVVNNNSRRYYHHHVLSVIDDYGRNKKNSQQQQRKHNHNNLLLSSHHNNTVVSTTTLNRNRNRFLFLFGDDQQKHKHHHHHHSSTSAPPLEWSSSTTRTTSINYFRNGGLTTALSSSSFVSPMRQKQQQQYQQYYHHRMNSTTSSSMVIAEEEEVLLPQQQQQQQEEQEQEVLLKSATQQQQAPGCDIVEDVISFPAGSSTTDITTTTTATTNTREEIVIDDNNNVVEAETSTSTTALTAVPEHNDHHQEEEEEEESVIMNTNDHVIGYLNRILNARVYDACIETELQHAKNLSLHLKNTIYFKREDTQPVFSFKIRGAYNKMAQIPRNELLSKGVVACSAGNHAQGVAMAAKMLSCNAIIVMPIATPSIKVNAVRTHGGSTVEVRLYGNNYDEAAAEAKRLQVEENMIFVHPFDDPYVIAGQGTIGMEILKSCVSKPLDAIFVCCGGGGMLAGIASYVKRVRPTIKIIGVEAADAAGMTTSLQNGYVTSLDKVGLFADGAAVKTVGTETFRICKELVDDMITVSTDEICSAIKLAYNDARVVLEPAGALGVAGLKKYIETNKVYGRNLVAITSGANMDFDRLRFVSERADSSERTLAVSIPEKPGTFRQLYSLIWPRNVTEFSYRYCENDSHTAHILISFQPVSNIENDFDNVLRNIYENAGHNNNNNEFKFMDVTHNELVKEHTRYMSGGRSNIKDERLFRFEFPESPGALQRFLLSLDMSWNISLFHYRNHGDDFGRVLVGIQTSTQDYYRLLVFLDKLDYRYVEETKNPVYPIFFLS